MRRFRLGLTLAVTVLLTALVAWLAPQQIEVSLYKLSLLTLAALAGYWIDREVFPYARPDGYLQAGEWDDPEMRTMSDRTALDADYPVAKGYELIFALAMIRRAILVGCAMLAVGLGA